eukprot:TRINITY_DN4036_c0_g1_i1.p1 TRINITY_DN4036_c0_g1~~TRINITY_DN4036_c0_g1_i1.p1  ORF type:complete len:450 (+),score=55.71 TRINITY_DN4036_c0_g1_i1:78-1427(+)
MANRVQLVSRCRKTKMCKFFLQGACDRGASCSYAHSSQELRPAPDLRCTQICQKMLTEGKCKDPECRFAHDLAGLKRFPGTSVDDESGQAALNSSVARPNCTEGYCNDSNLQRMAETIARSAVKAVNKFNATSQDDVGKLIKAMAKLRQARKEIDKAVASLEVRLRQCTNSTPSAVTGDMQSNPSLSAVSPGSFCSEMFHGPKELSIETGQHVTLRMPNQCDEVDTPKSISSAAWDINSDLRQASPTLCFGRQDSGFTDLGPVFDRQISGWSDIGDRGALFDRALSEGGTLYASMGLSIKNTFLDSGEGDLPFSPVSKHKRALSVPTRKPPEAPICEEGGEENVAMDTGSENAKAAIETVEEPVQEPIVHCDMIPDHRKCAAVTLPVSSRRALQRARANKKSKHIPAEPLPAGLLPSQTAPTLLCSRSPLPEGKLNVCKVSSRCQEGLP